MDTPNGAVGLGSVSTPPAPRPVGATESAVRPGPGVTDDGVALAQCLLLSLGRPVEVTTSQWDDVFRCAVAERCAALAWLRSESRIRTSAPPDVAARWSEWVKAHVVRVQSQLELLAQVDQWLEAHGISSVVLKGIPLGVRLYGSWWARTVNDIDLHVPPAQCDAAADVLRATGWRHLRGVAPQDIEFVKQIEGTLMMLELHGTLAGPWMTGDRFPAPEHERHTIRGHALRVQTGSFVPAYLASHLLQHSERPLLWILDFQTLWSGMLEDERGAARAAASRAGLGRVLALVERWTVVVEAIARSRDANALVVLRREILRPTPMLAFSQLLQSAAGPADAGRMLLQLVWPREFRSDPAGALRMWSGRLARRLLGGHAATVH